MTPEQSFEGPVAVLDVLGFKHHLADRGIPHVRDEDVGAVVIAAQHTNMWLSLERSDSPSRRTPAVAWGFGLDTMILWLDQLDGHSAQEAVMTLAHGCRLLLTTALWQGVALRGAIAYGSVVVCQYPFYALGSPFLEAHALEMGQRWAGVALCESAGSLLADVDDARLLGEQHPVVPWPIPLKATAPKPARLLAVAWPGVSTTPEVVRGAGQHDPEPPWDKAFSSDEAAVQEKLKNTQEFYRRYPGQYGPPIIGPDLHEVEHWQRQLTHRDELLRFSRVINRCQWDGVLPESAEDRACPFCKQPKEPGEHTRDCVVPRARRLLDAFGIER